MFDRIVNGILNFFLLVESLSRVPRRRIYISLSDVDAIRLLKIHTLLFQYTFFFKIRVSVAARKVSCILN